VPFFVTCRTTRIVLLMMLLALGANCTCEDSPREGDSTSTASTAAITPTTIIAVVGSRTITIADLLRHIKTLPAGQRPRFVHAAQRRKLAERMIEDELFAQQARRLGLDRDPTTRMAIRQTLADAQLSRIAESLASEAEIDTKAVRAYYRDNPNRFLLPERRGVEVVSFSSKTLATAKLKQARNDPSGRFWKQLLDSQRGKTAIVGVVGPPDDPTGAHDKIPAALRRAVFALSKVGQIAPRVITIGAAHHVLRYKSRTASQTRSLADASAGIRKLLRQQEAQRRREKLVAALRKRLGVQIDKQSLESVRLPEGFDSYVPYWERDGGATP